MSRRLTLLLLAVLSIKTAMLLVDHAPSFQFGDSASYLATATAKWIPPDRSFVYGFLLRPILSGMHSLLPVVVLQSLLSGIAAWLSGVCLLRYFNASFIVAALCSAVCALEPLQLMFERFVMTEAIATFGFAVLFFTALEFVRTGKTLLLVAAAAIGTFLIGVRFSFLPLVLILSIILPLFSPQISACFRSKRVQPILMQIAVSIMATESLLYGYRHLYGALAHEPPAYLSRDGDFLLADVSPLVIPADFSDAAKRNEVFEHLKIPLAPPENRLFARWLPGGLCAVILQAEGNNELTANRVARRTALRTIKRNPLGVLDLGFYTYRQFFHRAGIERVLLINQGQFVDPSPTDIQMISKAAGIDLRHRTFVSLTKRWQAISAPWCWLVILLPPLLTVGLLAIRLRCSRADFLCLLCSWVFLAGAVIPTEMANPRYLLPLTWLTCISLGSAWTRMQQNFQRSVLYVNESISTKPPSP